ncbi:cyclic nucleotide-gated ion channel 1-like [Pyrus communis]|uniref:cyclic nucleotide-gated ion channel 1-like n=1 Tax=Pyrus communis TaxID=23211 RepID=UPI0035BEC6B5
MAGNVEGVSSDVENPVVGQTHRTTGEGPIPIGSRGLTMIQKIFSLEPGPYLMIWNKLFVISCIFAVYMDPFFFYFLIIDQHKKCLQMDKNLTIVVFLVRSLNDFIFLVHLICEICYNVTVKNEPSTTVGQTGGNSVTKSKIRKFIAQKMPWLTVFTVIDFLALIPLPQLLMVVMFYNKKGSGLVEHLSFLNFFLLCQYVPRIYLVYLSAKVFKMTHGIWAKGLYNLILYILVSHILEAFWYLFSIERELTCWHMACVKWSNNHRECVSTFHCDDKRTTADIIILDKHCPLKPDGLFNFGIFLDFLKNQNTEQINFRKKLFYCFWWGLRNLSTFGTNLTTSTYVWENLFVVFISVVALLLFTYLIGNVQTFMQLEATKQEERRRKYAKDDVNRWMSRNEVPDVIKGQILSTIEQEFEQLSDADLHNSLFYILPKNIRTNLMLCLCMKTLKKVKKLQNMADEVLKSMCDCLKPVTYNKNDFVFRMGDPVDCMLFIIEGTVWTCALSDSQAGQGISSLATKRLVKGDFYGEELLDCASDSFTELPASGKHVKCQTKVEAFLLMANDLDAVVSEHRLKWEENEMRSQEVEIMAPSTIPTAYRRALKPFP